MNDVDEHARTADNGEASDDFRRESSQDWPDVVSEHHLDRADQELIGSYRSWLMTEAMMSIATRRGGVHDSNPEASDGR